MCSDCDRRREAIAKYAEIAAKAGHKAIFGTVAEAEGMDDEDKITATIVAMMQLFSSMADAATNTDANGRHAREQIVDLFPKLCAPSLSVLFQGVGHA